MRISVILPSLNPDEKLMLVVNGLIAEGFDDIIIVNDGSDEEHMVPFREAEKLSQVTILTHEVNKGKGRALKTAFDFCIWDVGSTQRSCIDGSRFDWMKVLIYCFIASFALLLLASFSKCGGVRKIAGSCNSNIVLNCFAVGSLCPSIPLLMNVTRS